MFKGWGKNKVMPTRAQSLPSGGILVADLDKLIADPVPFRWNGMVHFIKPISTKEFLSISEGLAMLDKLRRADQVTAEELLEGYSKVFSSACETIGRKEIEQMTQAQIGALYQLILDTITGKSHTEEKKSPMTITAPH